MKYLVAFQIVSLLFCIAARGDSLDKSPVNATIRLDKSEILPGEPIRILMCFELNSEEQQPYKISAGENPWTDYVPQIWVSNSEGNVIPNRIRPETQAFINCFYIFNTINPGNKYIFPFELHRWCTTDLKPGKYIIHLDRLKIDCGTPRNPETSGAMTNVHQVLVPQSLEFSVLQPDTVKLDLYYKNLYEKVMAYSSLPKAKRRIAKFDTNLFVHALSLAAIKYQLQFILEERKELYWEKWYEERIFNAFMCNPSLKVAEDLGEYYNLKHKEPYTTPTEIGICNVINIYAKYNDKQIRTIAIDFISRHPEVVKYAENPIYQIDGSDTGDGLESRFLELPVGADCDFPK